MVLCIPPGSASKGDLHLGAVVGVFVRTLGAAETEDATSWSRRQAGRAPPPITPVLLFGAVWITMGA